MARPVKKGLDYFPVDTTWDIKMKLVKARFGLAGTGCIIGLFQAIYSEGYALKWDEDTRLLFSADNGIDADALQGIIDFAVLKGVFHAGKLDKLGVLTSSGIQKRWLKVAKDSNRAIQEIEPSLSLLDSNGLSAQETELSAQEMQVYEGLSGTESTQSIVKENRIYREGHDDSKTDYSKQFDSFYKAYPKREGKKQAYKAYCSVVRKGTSPETIMERLETYKDKLEAAGTGYQYIRMPSTFLNNIEDYADGYEPWHVNAPEEREEPKESPVTPEERAMITRQYRELGLIP
jgi:hypothetical protein